jgi:redox-sensitive bicupin YhaK (pirin superfamily)
VKAVELVSFEESGDEVHLSAAEAARLLILTGQPLNEPVVGQGPFVMNTRDQIREAILDYQSGRMGRLA